MAETVTLEFLAGQLDRVLTEQAATQDEIHVLTAIVLRHGNTLKALGLAVAPATGARLDEIID
jgi:hypothetical protein